MYLHRILICETVYVVDRLTGRYFYLKFESLTKKNGNQKIILSFCSSCFNFILVSTISAL